MKTSKAVWPSGKALVSDLSTNLYELLRKMSWSELEIAGSIPASVNPFATRRHYLGETLPAVTCGTMFLFHDMTTGVRSERDAHFTY